MWAAVLGSAVIDKIQIIVILVNLAIDVKLEILDYTIFYDVLNLAIFHIVL